MDRLGRLVRVGKDRSGYLNCINIATFKSLTSSMQIADVRSKVSTYPKILFGVLMTS